MSTPIGKYTPEKAKISAAKQELEQDPRSAHDELAAHWRDQGLAPETAEQVATGDYGVDVAVRGPRDLRLLTGTFNDMAARLASTEEQRRRFLADITHELRNPLAVLQSEIEAQMDGVHPRDDRHVASLLEKTRRLGHLVDDLHTLALAETGRLVLHQEKVSFVGLVEEAVEPIRQD